MRISHQYYSLLYINIGHNVWSRRAQSYTFGSIEFTASTDECVSRLKKRNIPVELNAKQEEHRVKKSPTPLFSHKRINVIEKLENK